MVLRWDGMIQWPSFPEKLAARSLAVLSSGGDAPGMNAAIRAVVRFAIAQGCQVQGILKGYTGLLEERFVPLHLASVSNIIQKGGTFLRTDRCPAFYQATHRAQAGHILKKHGVEGLIVLGGDGSFQGAQLLEQETGIPVMGIPSTIDNDIVGTDETIGFDTAVNTAVEAIDRLRDTVNSFDRIFLVEVMGHNTGFLALQVGLAGGAEGIVIPEYPTAFEHLLSLLEAGKKRGKASGIIVVAETDQPGQAQRLATALEQSGYVTRVCILGHTQRGGAPSARDRLLASFFGASAVAFLLMGHSQGMVGIRDQQLVFVPFSSEKPPKKKPALSWVQLASILSS